MKYFFISRKVLMAAFSFTCLMSMGLMAQKADFTVRIKQPATDTLKLCINESFIFMAQGDNPDGSAFQPDSVEFKWDFGYNNSILYGPGKPFKYPEGGHYTVRLTVTSKIGEQAIRKDSVNVFIGMRPSFTNTRADQASICSGNEIVLTGFITPLPWTKDTFRFENTYPQAEFKWDGIAIQSDHNGIARAKPPLDQGDMRYKFTVTDDFGCYHDTTLTLFGVYASFTVTPKSGEAPLEVTMVVDSTSNGGFEGITYEWNFYENTDPLNILTTTDTKFKLERPGEYTSLLKAKYLQCSNVFTYEEYIKVDSSLLEIPNVFTPNGDGANDYFQVKALSLKIFSGRIFNRWGRVVYEWTDPKTLEKGWDGTYMNDGKPAPSGTYYYIISATGWDDKVYNKGRVKKDTLNEKMYYGFLTLIR